MTQPDPSYEAAIQAGAREVRSNIIAASKEAYQYEQAKRVIDAAVERGLLVTPEQCVAHHMPQIQRLVGEVERLRDENQKLHNAYHRAQLYGERLRDAIHRHRETFGPGGAHDSRHDYELWDVLKGGEGSRVPN